MKNITIKATKPLAEITPENLALRPPLYSEEFPFVIFWSEKSACTAVVKWFFRHLHLLDQALEFNSWVHDYENKVFKVRDNYLVTAAAALRAGKPAIKFVRDPFARAFSGYLELSRPLILKSSNHWATRVRSRIIQDLGSKDAGIEYTFSFRAYLLWLATQDNKKLDGHIREQHLSRDDHIDMEVFKIETLKEAFGHLERLYDLPKYSMEPLLLSSPHYHEKTSDYTKEEMLRILDLGVPVMKNAPLKYPNFDADSARNTEYDALVNSSFFHDIDLYAYGCSP